jgi:hypothetical protein
MRGSVVRRSGDWVPLFQQPAKELPYMEWVLPCTEWVPSRLASVLPEKIA